MTYQSHIYDYEDDFDFRVPEIREQKPELVLLDWVMKLSDYEDNIFLEMRREMVSEITQMYQDVRL